MNLTDIYRNQSVQRYGRGITPAVEGSAYFDTTTNQFMIFRSGQWLVVEPDSVTIEWEEVPLETYPFSMITERFTARGIGAVRNELVE